MPVTPRLWRNFASWFKSNNGNRATARREQCKRTRPFSLEQFEPRQLLASDIGLIEFGATGTHLVVAYDVAEVTAPAFNVSVYRSTDGITRDALVGRREVTLEQDRTVGRHVVGVGADFADLRDDYRLIAVVDSDNDIAETAEHNNEVAFRGGAFLTSDGTLHVHGGDSAETVRISVAEPAHGSGSGATGSASAVTVKIDEWTMEYNAATINEIHLRLHGGDDVLNVQPQVAHNIQAHGGEGNDRILTGAGSDWLVGGLGNDFISGRGNRDLIDGSEGDDTLLGGADQDTLIGWHGNDKLVGGAGRDIAAGGDGQDIVDGGADDDQVFGGRGADRIVNPPGREEARDRKSEDTLLTTTPEELIFAELSAEDESDSLQMASLESASPDSASSMEAYGYAGSAGPFWLESVYWATAPHYQPEDNEYFFTPFAINREDTWGPQIDFEITYYGTVTLGDFHYLQTSLVVDNYEEIAATVKDDDILEGTESFIAYIANAYGANGEMIIIDYPSTGQPASDFDGDPWSETAYIVDGDLTWFDSVGYALSETEEESPGGFMQIGEFHLLDVSILDVPDGGYFSLHYSPEIAVWLDESRSQALPSGGTIPQNSVGLYIEAVAPASNAFISLQWNYPWNTGIVDRIAIKAGTIDILAPEGAFAGIGMTPEQIPLTVAAPTGVTISSYTWSLASYGGNGNIVPTNARDVTFTGTQAGNVTAYVVVETQYGYVTASEELFVVETGDLLTYNSSATVIEPAAGEDTFFFVGDEAGEILKSVKIIAPTDVSDPYAWDLDYDMSLHTETGTVTLELFRPGVYEVEVVRDGPAGPTSEFLEIRFETTVTQKVAGAEKLAGEGEWEVVSRPEADLVLVAGREPRALADYLGVYPNAKTIYSVNDAVEEIEQFWSTRNGAKFSVLIVDHALPGEHGVGGPDSKNPPSWSSEAYINGEVGTQQALVRQALTDACRGKVNKLILGGCNVAGRVTPEDTTGEDFLQLLANEGQMTVEGYPKKNTYGSAGYFKRVVGGVWISKTPQ